MSSKKIGLVVEVAGFLSVLAGAAQSIKHPEVALPVFLGATAIFVGRLLASGETVSQVESTIATDVQKIGSIARTDLVSFAARLKTAAAADTTFIAGEARAIAATIEAKI
jgi:protein involved in polysaccharide export with SLBB domain